MSKQQSTQSFTKEDEEQIELNVKKKGKIKKKTGWNRNKNAIDSSERNATGRGQLNVHYLERHREKKEARWY